VTIPALHDTKAWTRWEQERRDMAAKFRNPKPAPHYHVASRAAERPVHSPPIGPLV